MACDASCRGRGCSSQSCSEETRVVRCKRRFAGSGAHGPSGENTAVAWSVAVWGVPIPATSIRPRPSPTNGMARHREDRVSHWRCTGREVDTGRSGRRPFVNGVPTATGRPIMDRSPSTPSTRSDDPVGRIDPTLLSPAWSPFRSGSMTVEGATGRGVSARAVFHVKPALVTRPRLVEPRDVAADRDCNRRTSSVLPR